jgi:succinoglycan biosynthesis transport protein ExoP
VELLSTQNRINIVEQRIESLRRQLEAVDTVEVVSEQEASTRSQLRKLELELAEARQRYAESHPEVQLLLRSVASLTARTAVQGSVTAPMDAAPSRSPQREALVYQLDSAAAELAELELLRDELADKQRLYDARLLEAPEIERQYRDLTRDYESAQQRYAEIRAKQMQAEIAEELELDQKAERFTVVEPPSLPLEPAGPRRNLLAMLGLSAALGGSVGLAWLRDLMNPALKSPRDLARLAEARVLTAVPYVVTPRERARERWRFALVLAIACAVGAAIFAGGHALGPVVAERLL